MSSFVFALECLPAMQFLIAYQFHLDLPFVFVLSFHPDFEYRTMTVYLFGSVFWSWFVSGSSYVFA